jgi:hypothetical protein
MKLIYIIILSLSLFANLSFEVTAQNKDLPDEFEKIFDKEEIKTISRIIEFYDSIVLSNTSNHNTIGEAYYQYLDSLKQSIPDFGDSKYVIPKNLRTSFFSSLNQQHLEEFYNIKDSINYLWRGEQKTIHSPYILELKYPGKYVDFLNLLSSENDFIKEYYENIVRNHDIGPSNFASVMELYRTLDLNNQNYRLVEIINLLMLDGVVLN